MKYVLAFTIAILSFNSLLAQSTQDSVKNVVNTLFKAMKDADSILLQSTFADSAVLQTIVKNKLGKISIDNDSVKDFASFVGKQQKNMLDEQIVFNTVLIDADLAMVWTPYKFYFKGAYSHCGVNSFQLVRINSVWKIQYLIDTRRKSCE